MHPNDKKERFSMAYIAAVAAHAGFHIAKPELDRDSVDGILLCDEGRRPRIEFQAKATARDIVGNEYLSFPLSLKNYNDLRTDCLIPRVLIVVVLPADEKDWLAHSEDELILRYCGYWASLAGSPERDNAARVTVPIPRHQQFDQAGVTILMAMAEDGLL